MPKVLRRLLVALAALAGAALVVVIAWGLDLRSHDGEVIRNTELAGRAIGGLTTAQLRPIVAAAAEEFEAADIRIAADGSGFTTDAGALGVSVDPDRTVAAALEIGRTGNAFARLAGWIRSLVSPRTVSVRVDVDDSAVYRIVREEDPGPREEPTEPRIVLRDGSLEAAGGEDGEGIDPADVIAELPDAAARGEPFVVEVDRGDIAPRYTTDDVEALIERARAMIREPVAVRAGGTEASLRAATVRSWVRTRATDDGLELVFDDELALDDLGQELAGAGEPARETSFSVEGGTVQLIPGRSGRKCCAAEAVDLLERALIHRDDAGAGDPGDPGAIELPLTERPPELTEAEARDLQIVERIATFTTRHPAGQPRVHNIHRIADLIRGEVILPGATFSVNGFVGPRTAAKGFVSAPVIEEGRFSEGVGGGISQFATTLFNAAFEGGLDFGEYQSHSIFISRYPYGREATLSYPHPDLEIENPSPYGVLIWPTYTNDSITVTLYSKKHVEVSQTGQTRSPSGNCTRVVTERTRRYLADGRAEKDTVVARYRPAEGVNC